MHRACVGQKFGHALGRASMQSRSERLAAAALDGADDGLLEGSFAQLAVVFRFLLENLKHIFEAAARLDQARLETGHVEDCVELGSVSLYTSSHISWTPGKYLHESSLDGSGMRLFKLALFTDLRQAHGLLHP
ncbi:hypothetical protein FVE85_8039 [Porphyridium purpureum]|uniref:Uncharacterized protein n=1 Tax=Porphyridium purpureum TaxID=35688 RepID=A0A5J4YNJ5_PORPP|nr:hypothetical protein FVE85_8039 [Porphyridium purpureum]|eukprot:POR9117..scf295_9